MPVQRSDEPEAFLAFERSAWNEVIGGYERLFAPLTLQTVAPLLGAADIRPGHRVLDVCTGPGVLAAAAHQRGAAVTGLDFAPNVVAAARRNVRGVDFREGDAQELPYGAGTFDRVLCGYGVIHLPEPDRAIAEMFRVLVPSGRAALSVWARPAAGNGYGLLFGAVKQHGRLDVPLPHGPDFFQFSDPTELRDILSEFGFVDVEVCTTDQFWDLSIPADLVNASLEGGGRLRALLKAQEPAVLAAIRRAVKASIEQFRSGDTYRVPMPAVIAAGNKP